MNINMNYELAKSVLLTQNHNHPSMTEAANFVASDVSLCRRIADEANLAITAVVIWGLVQINYPDGWAFVAPLNDQSMLVH